MEQLQVITELRGKAFTGKALHNPSTSGSEVILRRRNKGIADQRPRLPDVGESAHHDERRLLERQQLGGGEPWHGARRVFDSSPFSAFSLGILV